MESREKIFCDGCAKNITSGDRDIFRIMREGESYEKFLLCKECSEIFYWKFNIMECMDFLKDSDRRRI